MGAFAAGQVVLVSFPFSDLSAAKVRPAIVIAEAGLGDWLLCQVTSKPYGDPLAIQLNQSDFVKGSLRLTSYSRPGKLFTAHETLISGIVGELSHSRFTDIRDAIVRKIQRGK